MASKVEWKGDEFMRHVHLAMGDAVARSAIQMQTETKRQLNRQASRRGASPSAAGNPPAKDTGALSRSIQIDDSGLREGSPKARVGTNLVYARIHEKGGTIKPKRVKALPVPLNQEARDLLRKVGSGGLRSENLVPIKTRRGRLLLAKQVSRRGKRRAHQRGDLQFLFLLSKAVRIPKRPYMKPAFTKMVPEMIATIEGGLLEAARTFKKL